MAVHRDAGCTLTTQLRAHLGIELGGVITFNNTEQKLVGCGRRMASMNRVTVNQLIAPDASVGEWPRNGGANPAGIILDDEFAQCR